MRSTRVRSPGAFISGAVLTSSRTRKSACWPIKPVKFGWQAWAGSLSADGVEFSGGFEPTFPACLLDGRTVANR
jgi:hypothetical protein